MDAAAYAGAVDVDEDLLVLTGALAQVGVEVHQCEVWPCSSRIAWARAGRTASSDSAAPLGLPGTLMISVCPRTPAIERDRAAIGVLAAPARLIASPRPGTSKSITDDVACGVTSRGPRPVPPVVTTTSAPCSAAATMAPAMRCSSSGTTTGSA